MSDINSSSIDKSALLKNTISKFIIGIIIVGAVLFLPAGTLTYWNAWIYMGALFIPMVFALTYLVKKDPELLEKRMKMKEKETEQKLYVKISLVIFSLAFIIPGLDYRFGWSNVPLWVIILSTAFIVIGYIMFVFVMKENSYASRVIEIQQGQKVIDTGLYSIVRHPMYLSALLIYMFSPLTLGSYWALIPAIGLPIIISYRILNEEKFLLENLPNYKEYCQKIRYRLIPFIW
jgi:protein-S-isoprenylcysteine O-methyltransferase Ste14